MAVRTAPQPHIGSVVRQAAHNCTFESCPCLPTVQGGKRKAEEEAGATDGEGAAAAAKVRLRRWCFRPALQPAGWCRRLQPAVWDLTCVAAPLAHSPLQEGKPAGEKKKRKAGEGAADCGAVSEGDKPAKKKKKIVAEAVTGTGATGAAAPAAAAPGAPAAAPGGLSVAQLARMAGQMAAAGVAPAPAVAAAAEAGEAAEPASSQLSSPLRQQTQQASQAPTSAKKKGKCVVWVGSGKAGWWCAGIACEPASELHA